MARSENEAALGAPRPSALSGGFPAGVRLTPAGLFFTQDAQSMGYDEWLDMVEVLRTASESMQWAIGDAINFGEYRYGEKYAQALEATGWAYRTLCQWAFTAAHVPYERRRCPPLTFGHHRLVASMTAQDQERWLDLAVRGEWTQQRLRDEIYATPELRLASGKVATPRKVREVQEPPAQGASTGPDERGAPIGPDEARPPVAPVGLRPVHFGIPAGADVLPPLDVATVQVYEGRIKELSEQVQVLRAQVERLERVRESAPCRRCQRVVQARYLVDWSGGICNACAGALLAQLSGKATTGGR